jgi:hypothetical protein
MADSVFLDFEFFLLVLFSLVLPSSTYAFMLYRQLVSRRVVLIFGVSLIIMAGINIYLLGWLADAAKDTPSKLDDKVFASAVSLALFLFPAVFAGIGTHVVAHVMIHHLDEAEKRYDGS